MKYNSLILAAGKGTRMHSDKPKVIHELIDIPMINLVLTELSRAGINNNNVVVGYKKDEVIAAISEDFTDIKYVSQEEQLGTGHAVMQAKEILGNSEGTTIITYGDTPLITSDIFVNLIVNHQEEDNQLTVLSARVREPHGYGRMVYEDGTLDRIVEQAAVNEKENEINEINTGVYCIDNKLLFSLIDKIDNNNNQNEYYLTDLVEIFKAENLKVGAYCIDEEEAIMGVNDLIALEKATKIFQKRVNLFHQRAGVKFIDSSNTYIGAYVTIGEGTVIYPNNYITENVSIGKNNVLKPGNVIENTVIGDNNQIGPTSYLRGDNVIHDNVRIGCFVELKNVDFGRESKAAHLTYLGDTFVGKNVNIGCGVITANYDGVNKTSTKIGDNAFVGSNVNLIAPLTVGAGTFIAAGTTVTSDVSDDKFVIGRVRQEIKDKKK